MENCTPYDITIERNDLMELIEIEKEELIPLNNNIISSVCADIHAKLPKIPKAKLSRKYIAHRCHLQVPEEFREQYINTLFKHQEAISIKKYDLGLAKSFQHKIHLKNTDLVYRKQFKIPEAHHQFIEQTLEEWLKIGVVKQSDSLYNSPYFAYQRNLDKDSKSSRTFRT